MNTKLLTEDEWKVLDKIAECSKEDCWFYLRHDDEKNIDYIYDLVENKSIDLVEGITELEGMLTFDTYDSLSEGELKTYGDLLKRMGIKD